MSSSPVGMNYVVSYVDQTGEEKVEHYEHVKLWAVEKIQRAVTRSDFGCDYTEPERVLSIEYFKDENEARTKMEHIWCDYGTYCIIKRVWAEKSDSGYFLLSKNNIYVNESEIEMLERRLRYLKEKQVSK